MHTGRVRLWTVVVWTVAVAVAAGAVGWTPCGLASTPEACFVGVAPCASGLFCQGEILAAFQLSTLFNDSKTYVDHPLKAGVGVGDVVAAFAALSPAERREDAALGLLLAEYFDAPGSDLDVWEPPDWEAAPAIVGDVAAVDAAYGEWVAELNALWHGLGRKVVDDVRERPDAHSLLYVPNGFVVPGGRFREWYNWDTFFIIRGLLECGLTETAAGMLANFGAMVEAYGFVPNGGRVYYTDRSQPPLFALMVEEVYKATGNVSTVAALLPAVETEYAWWMAERVATLASGHVVNVYRPRVGMPRPEGYREDVTNARGLDATQAACFYAQIAAGAETGWDFSSRWFADGVSEASACVSSLAPVDLNAFLYQTEVTLARLAGVVGDSAAAARYAGAAAARAKAFDAVFWNEDAGLYVDYNVSAEAQAAGHSPFYASAFVPVWAGLTRANATRGAVVWARLVELGVLAFPGGVPTSLVNSGQQWDLPNAWAPLQYFAIKAADVVGEPGAGAKLAHTWLASNYAAYNTTRLMWEKYNAEHFGVPGGGGEYTVATGFGWSNGVVIALLRDYVAAASGRHL